MECVIVRITEDGLRTTNHRTMIISPMINRPVISSPDTIEDVGFNLKWKACKLIRRGTRTR